MVYIQLEPLSSPKHEEVLALELQDFQHEFLPGVASSIETALRYPAAKCLVLRNDGGKAIGFALYGIDDVTHEWKLYRLMIDKAHQGHGFGKAALATICHELVTTKGAKLVLVVFHEHNLVARRLYESFGFQEYGRDGTKVLARWQAVAV